MKKSLGHRSAHCSVQTWSAANRRRLTQRAAASRRTPHTHSVAGER